MYYDLIKQKTESTPTVIGGKLYVFWEFLKGFGVSDEYLKKKTCSSRKGKTRFYKNIDWPLDRRYNLIQYDTIPRNTAGSVGVKYELPEYNALLEYYREHQLREGDRLRSEADGLLRLQVSLDVERDSNRLTELLGTFERPADYEFFARIQVAADGKTLQHFQAYGLARWAAVLRLMSEATNDWCERNFARISTVKELRSHVMDYVKREKEVDTKALYGLDVNNEDYFMRRVRGFAELEGEEALRTLISDRFGNVNSKKRTYDHEAVLFKHYANPQKLDLLETHRRYVVDMLSKNIDRSALLKYSAAKKYLTTAKVQAAAFALRHGKQAADVQINPMHHRERPKHSLTMASGDGIWFGLPVKYEAVDIDPVTKVRTKKQVNTTLISFIWYDNASGAILGWQHNYGRHGENNRMVRESIRSVANLNDGHLPRELLMDTKLRKNKHIASFLDRAGIVARKKRPYNPKDSMAERFNKEINKHLRHMTDKWVNIDNKNINFVENPEHIRQCDPIPMSEAIGLIDGIFAIYNSMPQEKLNGLSPTEYAEANRDPQAKYYTDFQRTMLFDEQTITTVRNGVFKVKFEKKEYEFEVPNWQEHLNKTNKGRVRVYFNEVELINGESVAVCGFDDENDIDKDRYICDCLPLRRYSQATVEHTDEDKKALGHHAKRVRAFGDTLKELQDGFADQYTTIDVAQKKNQDYYKTVMAGKVMDKFNQQENLQSALIGQKVEWLETTEKETAKRTKREEMDALTLVNAGVDISKYS